ncbi:hypothetical protein Ade02nite_37330 [Paractinoplanes deccanensis]|uniref:DUF222 domain-containing protein n=1 Tax=Paractinoplanes deccanensis TaxID=113561 RepID=A0ABQ3Y522_9ACTN|nr:hypothetical protein [Actinoplanes deccanensis]GID75092.1 hypothetical protein Ade02nite_37330 [Actinoplanes deccanensis]
MSLIQELGARLRATSDELPTGQVTVAMEKLRSATEILMWVREQSVDPIGVPQLANATEAAERAAAALRLAQDAIAQYLASIGLAGDASAPPDRDWKAGLQPAGEPPAAGESPEKPEQLGPWWQQRVAALTGEPPPAKDDRTDKPDTAELLRRVASGVRAGDRARLGRELHGVNASTGLALSAVTPPVLHRLAGDLLGHEPRPEDVPRLRSAAEGRVRSLLPGTSPAVLDTLIARICRVPVEQGKRPPGHPADNAVTASVLTGVLLARLGRDAGTLDPSTPDPVRRPTEATDHG